VSHIVLAVLGTGLIFVSLMAFQRSIAPESQSQSLDTALATLEKSELVKMMIQVVTFPWHALIACKDAMVWLLMLPFRVISGTLIGLGRAGNATIDALNRCIQWLIHLPIHLAHTFFASIGKGMTGISETLANQSRNMGKVWSGSSVGIFFHTLADGFSSVTEGIRSAWIASNRIVGDSALALEGVGRKIVQILEEGVANSITGWLATKSFVIQSKAAVRTRWIDTNRTVGEGALYIDRQLRLRWDQVTNSLRGIRTRAEIDFGGTMKSLRAISIQGKDLVSSGYHKANEKATKIGLFLDDIVAKLFRKIQGLR